MTQVKSNFAKGLSVFLAVALMFTTLPGGLLKASAANTLSVTQTVGTGGYTQDDGGNVTISRNGDYTIIGDGFSTTSAVTVTGCTANVTLENVNIAPKSGCAFELDNGASVKLTLSGTNTLNTSGSGSQRAGLSVSAGNIVSISGTGSLAAKGNRNSAGIGGSNQQSCGTITILGGTVTANGGNGGAGIGSGWNGNGGIITISGGSVNAAGGGLSAGIGGGLCGNGGTVTISGGMVVATGDQSAGIGGGYVGSAGIITIIGGSVNSTAQGDVTDGNGHTEYCVTTTGIAANTTVTGSVCGGPTSDMQTDSNGKLYFWMPSTGGAVVKNSDAWYSASVSGISGNTTANLSKMQTLDISTGDITIADNKVTQVNNSNTYNVSNCVITKSGDGSTANTVSVTGGTHNIVLSGVDIESTADCAFHITGSSTVYMTLSGTNKLLSGSFYSGIDLNAGNAVTITGTESDSLESTGGTCTASQVSTGGAGIGGGSTVTVYADGSMLAQGGVSGNVTINGGTVQATGKIDGAGIGGNFGGNSGKVAINGGAVTAIGGNWGAGIGGGVSGNSGTTTITDGSVKAIGGNWSAGIGGGNGGNGGTTIITGGSVNASSIQGTPTNGGSTPANVYLTTVTVPSGTNVNFLAVKQGGAAYSYGCKDIQTDAASYGKLYLWLPANAATTTDVTTESGIYSGYHGTVDTSNASVLKMGQNLTIGGVVDGGNYAYGSIPSVTVLGGASDIAVAISYSGHDNTTNTDLPANDTTIPTDAGTYTVTAVKTGNSAYNSGTATASFTISQKSLTSSDISVSDISNQEYDGSAHTPSVTVKDGSTDLVRDTEYSVTDETTGTLNPDYMAVGTYTLEITGRGNYSGTVGKTFTIEAAPTVSVSGDTADWCASLPFTVTATAGSSGIKSVTVTDSENNTNDITASLADGFYSYTASQSGTYTFTVTSNSGFKASQSVTVSKIDSGAPSLSSVSGNPASPAQSAALSVTATPGPSGIGGVSVSYSTDGGQSWTRLTGASISDQTNANGSHTYTYTTTQNGTYKFTVTSNVGVLVDSNSVDVTQIDTAKPVVSIDSNGYTGGAWINKDITLNVSNSTANLGLTTYEYSTDGGKTWSSFSGSLTDSTEGVTTYSFRATSESGVQSDIKAITVNIDKTAPETHQITIANNNFTKFLDTITFGLFFKDTQTATITAADSGSGAASVQCQLVHNQSDYDPNGTWTAYPSGGVSLNPDNKYIVYAKITDNAGNFIIVNSNGVIVDQTSPDLTLSAPSGWQTSGTFSVGVTASDALAGLKDVSYTTNEATPQSGTVTLSNGSGSIALADEGDYILTVTATDNAGNPVSKMEHIQWDKTKPTISVSVNTTSPTQAAMLTVAATAGTSGIKSVTVSEDGGPAQDITGIYQYGYPVLDNGSYVLTVTNNAGVSVNSSPVVVTQIDTAKPVVQINSNGYQGGTWTKNDVKLDISNITQNFGTTAYEYSTDGGKTWSSFNGSLTDSTEGVATYSFRATSQSGVVSDVQSITVQIDKTAPTGMAIGFKQNPFKTVAHFVTFGLFFGDSVDVNFSSNDKSGSGVDHYEYQTVAEGDAFNPSSTWQAGSLSISPEYKGTIYARAVDKAGNESGYVTKSLVVDQTAPVITANSGNLSLNTFDTNTSIPVEVRDNGSGVGSVTYQVNGGAVKSVDLTTDTYSDLTKDYCFNIGNLPDGVYDATINAQDNSGNAAATATVHVVKNAAQTGFRFTSATLNKTYGDTPFTIAATGGQGGGAITYAVTSGTDVLNVDAATGKTTVQKAGTAVITATKAADSGYCQATAELTVNVSKATPTIQIPSTASDIQVVGKLSSSKLSGGNASVPGVFIWTNPDTVVSASGSYDVTFTPTDTDNYKAVNGKVAVAVSPLLTGGGSSAQLDFTGVTLPAGVTSVSLESNVQGNGSATYSVVESLIAQDQALGNLNNLAVYDLKLLNQNGDPIENFSGKIKVKIPIPKGMSGNLKIFWYNPADGTLTDMNATQENGYLTFEITHFSYYAIAQLTPSTGGTSSSGNTDNSTSSGTAGGTVPNPKTGSNGWPLIPLALLGGSSAAGLAVTRRRAKYQVKK